ncbi:hypothetical protein C8J35_1534 [Rhizobium sp. PP-F2F-G38]|nr:hypothetical protein C8J35_1534 [Rhizobium sp. PP-F2F-G38]
MSLSGPKADTTAPSHEWHIQQPQGLFGLSNRIKKIIKIHQLRLISQPICVPVLGIDAYLELVTTALLANHYTLAVSEMYFSNQLFVSRI